MHFDYLITDDMARRTPKVFSYQRFSSGNQSSGSSLERQEKIFREAFEKNYEPKGFVFDGSFIDEGVSGFRGKNVSGGELGKIIDYAKRGQRVRAGDTICIESVDRFGRDNPISAFRRITELVYDYGIRIDFLDRAWCPALDEETLEQNIEQIISECRRANEESKKKSERIAEANELKRQSLKDGKVKYSSRCPAWLEPLIQVKAGTTKTETIEFKKIPEKVKIVKRIYKMKLAGNGAGTIVNTLTDEGIDPLPKGSKKWSKAYVEKILRWKAVIGIYQPQKVRTDKKTKKQSYVNAGDPILDYYPKIITEKLFYSVQREKRIHGDFSKSSRGKSIARQAQSNSTEFLFAGLLRCGYGQGMMRVIRQSKSKGHGAHYYPNHVRTRAKRKTDITNGWECGDFEKQFVKFVYQLDWEKVYRAAKENKDEFDYGTLNSVEGRLDEIDEEISNYVDAIGKTGFDSVIQKKLTDLKERRLGLVIDLEYEKEKIIDSETAADFALIKKAKSHINDERLRTELRTNINQKIESIELFGSGWKWNQKTFLMGLEWLEPQWRADYMDCHKGELPKWDGKMFSNKVVKRNRSDRKDSKAPSSKRYSGKRQANDKRFFIVNFRSGYSVAYLPSGIKESANQIFYDVEPTTRMKAGIVSMYGSDERGIYEMNPRAIGFEIERAFTDCLNNRKRKHTPANDSLTKLKSRVRELEEKEFNEKWGDEAPKQKLFSLVEAERQAIQLTRIQKTEFTKLKKRFPKDYARWSKPSS